MRNHNINISQYKVTETATFETFNWFKYYVEIQVKTMKLCNFLSSGPILRSFIYIFKKEAYYSYYYGMKGSYHFCFPLWSACCRWSFPVMFHALCPPSSTSVAVSLSLPRGCTKVKQQNTNCCHDHSCCHTSHWKLHHINFSNSLLGFRFVWIFHLRNLSLYNSCLTSVGSNNKLKLMQLYHYEKHFLHYVKSR